MMHGCFPELPIVQTDYLQLGGCTGVQPYNTLITNKFVR